MTLALSHSYIYLVPFLVAHKPTLPIIPNFYLPNYLPTNNPSKQHFYSDERSAFPHSTPWITFAAAAASLAQRGLSDSSANLISLKDVLASLLKVQGQVCPRSRRSASSSLLTEF